MDFSKRKAQTLASISSPSPDKSPKGNLDEPIIPLINLINTHSSYFTTSSCSGRISILSQPIANNNNIKKKKKARGGSWIYITHEPANSHAVINLLFNEDKVAGVAATGVGRVGVTASEGVRAEILGKGDVESGLEDKISGDKTLLERPLWLSPGDAATGAGNVGIFGRNGIESKMLNPEGGTPEAETAVVERADVGSVGLEPAVGAEIIGAGNVGILDKTGIETERLNREGRTLGADTAVMGGDKVLGKVDVVLEMLNPEAEMQVVKRSDILARMDIESALEAKTPRAKIIAKVGVESESITLGSESLEGESPEVVAKVDVESDSDLVFRYEPLIIAVECKDVEAAKEMVGLAIGCGFRESGITSVCKRVMVSIRCSIRLEVPLGFEGKVMVGKEYVEYLVGIANEKMESNRKRTDGFREVLESKLFENYRLPRNLEEKSGVINVEEANEDSGIEDKVTGSSVVVADGEWEAKEANLSSHSGSLRDLKCSIPLLKIKIVGEPVDKLFLWGHSACTINCLKKVFVFGGFGGKGRHARRNETLILDLLSGTLVVANLVIAPSPRLSHTSSVVGESIFTIGGRGDPLKILNDVWVLNVAKNEWKLQQCAGSVFHPRHRHAAAVVGASIYVFGGIDNETVSSSMQLLNTNSSHWSDINVKGDWPCSRHSHSLVAVGSQLFMFGGYDGEKALGDLYSFDTSTHLWKKEKTTGRAPYPRFSHSMFFYKHYLGIVGGCPVRQHYQEIALLDIRKGSWRHVKVNSTGGDMFVRSTASVIDDDLVMIGGGAACYAFGTKFSEPTKIDLLPLTHAHRILASHTENVFTVHKPKESAGADLQNCTSAEYRVLKIERKFAKMAKDTLKQSGWLDLGRKVYSHGNGLHVHLPVTDSFSSLFQEMRDNCSGPAEALDGLEPGKSVASENTSANMVFNQISLNHILSCGGLLVIDEAVCLRRAPKSPQEILSEGVGSLIKQRGLSQKLLEQLPTRWGRLGDIFVLPATSFEDPVWDTIGEDFWPAVARLLGTSRLARQGHIAPTGTRDSTLEILVGNDGWVHHRENGIFYSFDTTKCMFSWGNLSEKLRMGNLDCKEEVIVDLFAGIGYFVLPFLVRAKAKFVYACEWNPHAIEALRRNVETNSIAERCVILEGDNQITAPMGIAHRVCLGLLPSSEGSWPTAVRSLRSEGGMLHVHGNVKDTEENSWSDHVAKSISYIAKSEGLCWEVAIQHVERVKWYGPHIRHLVADVRCRCVS